MASRYEDNDYGYRADRGRSRRYDDGDFPGPSRTSEPDYDYSDGDDDGDSYRDRRTRNTRDSRSDRRVDRGYDRDSRPYPQTPEKRRSYSHDYDDYDAAPRRIKHSHDWDTDYERNPRRDDGGHYEKNRNRGNDPSRYNRNAAPTRGNYPPSSDESDPEFPEMIPADYDSVVDRNRARPREQRDNRKSQAVPYDDELPDADYGDDPPVRTGNGGRSKGAGLVPNNAPRRDEFIDDLLADYGSDSSGSVINGKSTAIKDTDDKRGRLSREDFVTAGLVGASGIALGSRGGGHDNPTFELNELDGRRRTEMGNTASVEPYHGEGQGRASRSAAGQLHDNVVSITLDDASSTSSVMERGLQAGVAIGARRRLRRAGPLTEDEELRAVMGDGRAAAKLREHQRAELEGRRERKIDGKKDVTKQYDEIYRQTLAKLETTPKEKLTGWKKFKLRRSQEWKRTQRRWREILGNLEIWRGSLKSIEGNFGNSVTSYFRFLKWLLGLNIFIMLLLFGVIILTQIFMAPDTFTDSLKNVTRTPFTAKAQLCTEKYDTYVQSVTNNHSSIDQVLDFFSGTGFMEQTVLFYGYFFNKTYIWVDDTQQNYNMPVAYIMATAFYFLVSLVLMVKYTARGLKESQMNSGEKFYHSCNKIFCGWDYSLVQDKAAKYKQKNIYDEIMHDLQEQYLIRKQANRTTGEKCKLYSLRAFVNIVVIIILGGAGFLIYWTSMKTLELAEDPNNSGFETLLIQFLPSITITVLNFIVPFLFEKVVGFEDYSAEFEVKLTIGRTVILRLASVAVLVMTLGLQLLDCPEEQEVGERCESCITNVYCWETYVGQQFFKLVILDFFVVIGVTFLVQYPRKFVVTRYESKYKIVKMVGPQEFEIPKNVLDLVYTQTLCWLGAFYSPLIPAITVLKMFFFFYTKKISLLQTCVPSRKSFRASNIQSFFMTILMLSIVLCIIPIVYTITKVAPSQSCGPFRIWDSQEFKMYEVVGHAVATLPGLLREIMYFVGTWTFYIPLYIVLCMFIYYYMAVAAGNRKMVELLKEQLALEGKDKQFLLGQVRDALMRGELNS